MITKLPRWVWLVAWTLSFIAGIVNIVGLLGFEQQAITHLTGVTSLLALAITSANSIQALHFTVLIGSFILGSFLSGFIIQERTLQLGRSYGVALLLSSTLLFASVPLLRQNSALGMYAAACACGLQNAIVSTFSGSIVRTTHLSGMFTDLGILLGQLSRGHPTDGRRLSLVVTVISGFLCGGMFGAMAYRTLSYWALFIPASLTTFVSLACFAYCLRKDRIA